MKITILPPKLFVLLLLTFFTFSCSDEDEQKAEEAAISNDEITRINLLVSQDLQAQYRLENPDSTEKAPENTFVSSEVQIIDGEYYLVSFSNETITTSLLKTETTQSGRLALVYSGISCTSSSCYSGTGCVPDKNKKDCTACVSCTRTLTSD